MWLVIAGWLASLLVFSTFFMKTMAPLRLVAIASNVAFMSYAVLGLVYGVFEQLYPILALHACLLPLNVARLRQLRRLVDAIGGASDEEAIQALVPYMKTESRASGDVVFRLGDAADKLVILARLAFGIWLDRGSVVTARRGEKPGITGVTSGDLEAATKRRQAIRLLAAALRTADGAIEASVLPTEVPLDSPLGQTHGVRNRIEIESDRLGWIGIEGPGAGGAATAAAVLADLAAIATGGGSTWGALPPAISAVPVG